MGVHEGGAGRELMHVEEFLFAADAAMVAFLGLLAEEEELVVFFFGGVGDGVDSLERVVSRLTEPVGGGVLHD